MRILIQLIPVVAFLAATAATCDPLYVCGNHAPPQGPHGATSIAQVKELTEKYGCADWIVIDPTAKLTREQRSTLLEEVGADKNVDEGTLVKFQPHEVAVIRGDDGVENQYQIEKGFASSRLRLQPLPDGCLKVSLLPMSPEDIRPGSRS